MKPFLLIKTGGRAFEAPPAFSQFAEELARCLFLCRPVLVHGGGRRISKMLQHAGRATHFVQGVRVTSREDLPLIEKALWQENAAIAEALCHSGISVLRLSGYRDELLQARRVSNNGNLLGHVGEITSVRVDLLQGVLEKNQVPVISPVAGDSSGNMLNINADYAAASLAIALRAHTLLFLSDVPGILIEGQKIDRASQQQLQKWIRVGQIQKGMLVKVKAACQALAHGVRQVLIGSWSESFSLRQIIGHPSAVPAGTWILPDPPKAAPTDDPKIGGKENATGTCRKTSGSSDNGRSANPGTR